MEDDVYVCSWSKTKNGYEMWLKSRPQVRSLGESYEEAAETLVESIQDAGGAIHAVLEFDPPLQPAENVKEFLNPSIVTIWGDDCFEQGGPRRSGSFANAAERDAHLAWDDAHYEGGCCGRCNHPLGTRTAKVLELSYVRSGYGGGFVSIKGGTSYVFSETFLALLTDQERESLELRKVVRSKSSRVSYYELIGPSGPKKVGLKHVKPHSGWVCDDCGYQCFSYSRTGFDLRDFVAAEDLPNPLPGIFTVGTQPHVELTATSKRWAELVGQKGTRGMLSEPIGVLPTERVEHHPQLRKLSEPDPEAEARKRAYWGNNYLSLEERMERYKRKNKH